MKQKSRLHRVTRPHTSPAPLIPGKIQKPTSTDKRAAIYGSANQRAYEARSTRERNEAVAEMYKRKYDRKSGKHLKAGRKKGST